MKMNTESTKKFFSLAKTTIRQQQQQQQRRHQQHHLLTISLGNTRIQYETCALFVAHIS